MSGPVLVVNPNANPAVTAGISRALDPFRLPGAPEFEAVTLEGGPFTIESAADGAAAIAPLLRLVAARADAAAVVIACYSDPGLDACRERFAGPVLGIGECGALAALARADLFGVIALSDAAIARHRPALRRAGLSGRLAGERAAALGVAESQAPEAFPALAAAGRALLADGAGAVVLGCAGMARHRAGLEKALGVPVIDPVQAAAAMALGALLTNQGRTP